MKLLSKHFVTSVTVAVLACCFAFGLSACGQNEAEAVRSVTEYCLSIPTTISPEKLEGQFGNSGSSVLENFEELGLDFSEFASHMFANYDYTIGDITVDGNTATADVSITNINIKNAFQKVFDDLTDDQEWSKTILQTYAGNQDETTAEFTKAIITKFSQTIDGSKDLTTTDMTIHLTKANNEWTIDESDEETLLAAMFGGTDMKAIEQDLMKMGLSAGMTVGFNALKNPDDETINALLGAVEDADIQRLRQAGVDVNNLFKHAFARMEYKANDVTFVSDDEAVVDASISNVDFGKAMESAQNDLQNDPELSSRIADLAAANDENGIYRLFFDQIIKKLDESNDMVTSNVKIKFHQDENGKWAIDDTSQEQLAAGMLGGYSGPDNS